MSAGYDPRGGGFSYVSTLKEAIRAQIVEVHTAMPAEIVSFDAATQTASVQLCIERETVDDIEPITQLGQVPVMVQGGGGFSVTFPVKEGDPCLVLFVERGMDNWYLDGGCQPAQGRRTHHLSDAVCIPGLRTAPQALGNYDADNITIRSDDGHAQFCMTPDGKFALTNGAEELLSIVDELAALVGGLKTVITTGSSAGTHPNDKIADVAALRARLAGLIK